MIITGRIDNTQLDRINKQLIDYYGKGPQDLPYFRVIWGGDEYENRVMTHTDEGLLLLNPEVRRVPKYWLDLNNKYILEALKAIPEYVETDLVAKLSYEPMWTFEDKHGNPLYPRWEAIRFVLETVKANMEHKKGPYKDPDIGENPVETALIRKERLDEIQMDLFSDETSITDALKLGTGIVVPGNSGNSNA